MSILVQKYGGSSLASIEDIKKVAQRVATLHRQGEKLLVVVSAMGKTTDQLVQLASQISAVPHRRELDMLLTTGERVSGSLLSMALNELECPAISFTGSQAGVFTDRSHNNAQIIDIKPIRVEAELNKNKIVVMAGFQGVCPKSKEITTLGRGGTDTTAVAMAAYFNAKGCEIMKDVDGVYSADPHIVEDARHFSELSYSRFMEMTFWGAKVQHYRSVELASRLKIPLRITFAHKEGKETIINGGLEMYETDNLIAVNSHGHVRLLKFKAKEFSQALAQLHEVLYNNNLPWPQILGSDKTERGWNLFVTAASETLQPLTRLLESNPNIEISEKEFASVTATCQGAVATHLPELLGKALEDKQIQIENMIFSPMSLTAVVPAKNREQAVKLIHAMQTN